MRALLWIGLYLALILGPLMVLLIGDRPRGGGFSWDFALALGYVGLVMMGVQFWLTARFKRATAPFGIDLVYYFHRYLAVFAFVIVAGHVALLFFGHRAAVGPVDPREAAGYMSAGWLGFLCFAIILVTSLFRKVLRLDYEWWRVVHIVLAVAGVVLSGWHMLGSGSYLEDPLKRGLWVGLLGSLLALTVWVRLVRPWRLSRRPWRVTDIRPEVGHTWTLEVEPEEPPPFDYRAGQFAWLTLRASPFAMKEHPFSISSTPTRPGRLEFTIKELGDFTSTIGTVKAGEVAYVDGPYGNFGTDRHPDATGFVFVVGGVGVAPAISMLRELADENDPRPHWLFYGNRMWDRVALREEIEAIAKKIDLTVVHVLLEPHEGWTGEVGYVTRDVMTRNLPEDLSGLHFMVCGPTPMIRLVEENLREMKVSLRRLHSEIFDLA